MIISLLEKSSSSVFDQIFNLIQLIFSDEGHKEKAHRPYLFEKTRVSFCIRTFTRKTKVSSYKHWGGVKSKIGSFASQHLLNVSYFITWSYWYSVGSNDRSFFGLIFHEPTSNYYRHQSPFKREDILENNQTHEICRAWDVSLSPYTTQRLEGF